MAARSSILTWRIPWTAAWWAAVHGVAKSWTRLKLLSTAHTAHKHLRTLLFVFSKKLCIFSVWLCWVFVTARAALWVRCVGFSMQWLLRWGVASRALLVQWLQRVNSVISALGLQSACAIVGALGLCSFAGCGGFPGGMVVKNLPAHAGDTREAGSIPQSGISPGGRNGNPTQYSCLENSMDCIVHGVAKNQTRLSDFHFTS